MLRKVERIRQNPLEAALLEEEEEVFQEELLRSRDKNKIYNYVLSNSDEIQILERLIIKTGALLAVGFGEAGSRIIAENMNQGDAVDPLIPGKKIIAIFGFCDIRTFTNITEVLEEQVMVFVNEIAEIVHSEVNSHHGSANKNIGDAFLLVWKIPPQALDCDDKNKVTIKDARIMNAFAELALLSFLKIMCRVQTSQQLEKYRQNKQLQEAIPYFTVKLGYGLHIGWAIEGAIGSSYKIDASYLSPNVNMASRLESGTKQYGVNILMSGSFYKVLSPQVQAMARFIDKVTVKGSIFPIELFTFDIDINRLGLRFQKMNKARNKKMARYIERQNLIRQFDKIIKNRIKIFKLFETDDDIRKCHSNLFTEKFYSFFSYAMRYYIQGNWKRAKFFFEKTLNLIEDYTDGPSKSILEYINQHNGRCPSSWRGYRELVEK